MSGTGHKLLTQTVSSKCPSTDRKSLLPFRVVSRESEAEGVRFHERRVTKVGPASQTRAFLGSRARPQAKKAAKRPSELSKDDNSSQRNHDA